MFRQPTAPFDSDASNESEGGFNVVAECLACSTLLLRYLLCLGPRPERSRSVETADLYHAPSPSASSSSRSGQPEVSAASVRSLQREDRPLLKGGDGTANSSSPQQGQELQGFSKAELALKEGLELGLPEEDCCPTCLEPYTFENPAIMTKCRHSFHLACIYEWLERSKTCPVCSRQMEFEELEAAFS